MNQYSNAVRILVVILSLSALILILLSIEFQISKWLKGLAFMLIAIVLMLMAKRKTIKNES